MDGVLIIDKPEGMTSHDVVNRVRRVMGTKRVGHTGTLDPFATGVLVILVGKATRMAQFIDKDEKEYAATVAFGYRTNTGDRTGERQGEEETRRRGEVLIEDIMQALPGFRGEIEQVPPMYSAKKVAGKKLYELARRGEEIERKAIPVNISKLEIDGELHRSDSDADVSHLNLIVRCSAGTYIRTLAEDIGKAVGSGAHLKELRRTHAGRFALEQAVTLEQLEQTDDPAALLLPIDTAVEHLPEFRLDENRVAATLNGMSTRVNSDEWQAGGLVQMTSPGGKLIAIGIFDAEENSVRPKVVLG
ncbi:MAG: tRNA pseudouridine(55) synthase TruB [Acidobacteriota bacterium]|nr:MAG: tRNA pseudouridine(55) synthase TruB [Acidobacteriota bacterium]